MVRLRLLGLGMAVAGTFAVSACGAAPGGTVAPQSPKGASVSAKGERFGTASGWVGKKSLWLSLMTMSSSGRYGDKDVRLDFYFGDRVRGTVGATPIQLSSFNGQIHGTVGKYPVFATYLNGHVTAFNGARSLTLNEYSTGFGGWVGHDTVNVSFLNNLSTIEKIGILGVILTELTPEQP